MDPPLSSSALSRSAETALNFESEMTGVGAG